MAVYSETDGQVQLWFGYVDDLLDFLLENGLKPILELGFCPGALAANAETLFWWNAHTCPPKDYDKWHFLVQKTLEHCAERYGTDELKTWYFEVWNEPNLDSFWHGTQEEYFRLYEASVDAVKSVCRDFRVGGPSVSGADFREDLAYFKAFIAFCESKKLPLDFVSGRPYPTYWPLDTDGNEQMGYMHKAVCAEFLDKFRDIVRRSAYADAEIHLTEWNSSPSPRDLVHDTPFEAPFILYNVTKNFGKADSLAYWAFTDIFEENGPGTQPFHGGFGLLNANGIKKPSYWAYVFLAMLGDEIVEITENHIVTKQDDDYQILLWNYCDYKEAFAKGDRSALTLTDRDGVFENKDLDIDLSPDLQGEYTLTVYTLDENASALHNWVKLGAPQYPTKAQVQLLKAQSRPAQETRRVTAFRFHETLRPHEVRALLLTKA